jgi:hypothetical protein
MRVRSGMNKKLLESIIKRYKEFRGEYLNDVYQTNMPWYKRLFTPAVDPSSAAVFEAENEFYNKIALDIVGLENLGNHNNEIQDLKDTILFLKNKTERVQFSVDFLNFFHGIVAFIIALVSILARIFTDQVWFSLFTLVVLGALIFKVFTDRAIQRYEIVINKEIINILEHKLDKIEKDLYESP